MRAVRLAAAVAVGVAIVDQLTKRWAVDRLTAGPCASDGDACIDLFWTLRLHLHFNPGAAFSTGVGLGPLFGVLAFGMILVLFSMVRGREDVLGTVLLGAIAGGAIGNLTDRILRAEAGFLSGEVVDFIDLQWWPIFNIADAAVVIGVIGFVIHSLVSTEDSSTGEASAEFHDCSGGGDTTSEVGGPPNSHADRASSGG